MRTASLVLVSLCCAAPLAAQPDWTQKSLLAPRQPHGLAYDPIRQRAVLFGGQEVDFAGLRDDTWEWDGSAWAEHSSAVRPSLRYAHAMAWDGNSQRVLLFGGRNLFGDFGDTWAWNGAQWEQLSPASSPPSRYAHAMAWDPVRGRLVLFGGAQFGGPFLNDTWEWNGINWTQVTTATTPSTRSDHAMSWDGNSSSVLLFGGSTFGSAETWLFDGVDWTQDNPPAQPSNRVVHAMAWDAVGQRVLVYGGRNSVIPGSFVFNDTWAWNGTTWTRLDHGGSAPGGREHPGMFFDAARGEVVLFGGVDEANGWSLSDTWTWDDTNEVWQLQLGNQSPEGIERGAMAFDAARGEVVMFNGSPFGQLGINPDATWTWDGSSWTRHAPVFGQAPGLRRNHAMAYDSARQVTVLFGGNEDAFNYFNDTWEWNGSAWTLRLPAASPPFRSSQAMVYDAARGETVIFGGDQGSGVILGDTWVWNGTVWAQRTPGVAPSARYFPAMAFDASHQVAILYGGASIVGGLQLQSDTWIWNGTTWTQLTPANNPGGRWQHTMAFDTARNRIVLFGGRVTSGLSNDLWEWTGSNWIEVSVGTEPGARTGHAMTYDPSRSRLVVFGGHDGNFTFQSETWEHGGLAPQAIAASGAGCPTGAEPVLVAHGTPTLGASEFALDLVGAQPGAACLFGLSAQGRTLPIGGCTLFLARPLVLIGDTTDAAGFATLGLPIPFEPLIGGIDLHCQGFALDANAPLGLAFTGSLRLTFGE